MDLYKNIKYYYMTEETVIEKIDGFWEANSESESENSQEEKQHDKLTFRKLKRKILNQYDMNLVHKYSTALDVFVRYIQCYHILYLSLIHI